MLMQGVEDAAVGNQEQASVGVGGDAPGDDRRDALENLRAGIGVSGQYVSERLVRSETVPCLDVANDLSVAAAEIAFDEPGADGRFVCEPGWGMITA